MEPERFPLRDYNDNNGREAGEPDLYVRTSDEEVALFDSRHIVESLMREASITPALAVKIGVEIREFIQSLILKLGPRTINSSLIRGLVENKLLEFGLEEAHRSHSRLGLPQYDVDRIINGQGREIGRRPYSPEGTSLMLAEAVKREYALSAVFSEPVANAHLSGDIHIHNVGAIDRPYSLISSLDYVKQWGLNLPGGFASSRAARHPEVLVTHIVKISGALRSYLAGPLVWDSFNFGFAPLLEGASAKLIKQLAQTLAFEFSSVARGGEPILADLHLDWDAPSYLAAQEAIGPGGEPTGRVYAEYSDDARRFLQALIEVYLEGDAEARPFLSPRLILHINKHFNHTPGYRSALDLVSRLAVERGGLTVVFDRDENAAYSSRYGVAENPIARVNRHALSASQFQIVSLNLPRVGYLTNGNQVQVFEELSQLMDVAAQAHLEKRVFLEKLLALNERGPLSALARNTGGSPLIRLNRAIHSIGVVGLNELCRTAFRTDLHDSQDSLNFARKVIAHLGREVERLSQKHNVPFVLSGQPSEVSADRLARLDLRFYGAMAEAVVCGDRTAHSSYYTDGIRLSVSSDVTILDRMRTEGLFHESGLFNSATEVWMGESVPRSEDLGRMISQGFYQSACSGLSFCPEFTVCLDCKSSARGLRRTCEECGSARVDGLASSKDRCGYTSSWQAERLAELRDRRRLDVSEI